MMIYKCILPMMAEIDIWLPQGAQILHIDTQYGVPQLWALVDASAPLEAVRIKMRGTDGDINFNTEEWYHLGTIQMNGGALIWHYFGEVNPSLVEAEKHVAAVKEELESHE